MAHSVVLRRTLRPLLPGPLTNREPLYSDLRAEHDPPRTRRVAQQRASRASVPAPVPQQPAVGAGLAAAIAQGAARSITARPVDKFLTNPPDWLRALWHALPRPWE
ncbi:hypothetical protein ACFXPY_35780 [Streptomyces sp. NPDC059153]|uniref:hypothetical protein n=1 Tax=Streptomyces sp. NPDC059153 TaxID=3346743 RepID=UPI0036C85CA5